MIWYTENEVNEILNKALQELFAQPGKGQYGGKLQVKIRDELNQALLDSPQMNIRPGSTANFNEKTVMAFVKTAADRIDTLVEQSPHIATAGKQYGKEIQDKIYQVLDNAALKKFAAEKKKGVFHSPSNPNAEFEAMKAKQTPPPPPPPPKAKR